MVFQSYALYPHMSAEENIGFGLRMNGMSKSDVRGKVEKPRQSSTSKACRAEARELSGGQRQRVAIGRAIVRKPEVFLFDEPLSNLDAERAANAARNHQASSGNGRTMIYVTHDQTEAMALADKIVVLGSGGVEQVGTPLKVYDDPDNAFVAGLIGSPKWISWRRCGGGASWLFHCEADAVRECRGPVRARERPVGPRIPGRWAAGDFAKDGQVRLGVTSTSSCTWWNVVWLRAIGLGQALDGRFETGRH